MLTSQAGRAGSAATHPLVWMSGVGCGLVIAVAGFLTGFSVRIEASIGAGGRQRVFDYERTFSLLSYGHPRYIAVLVAVAAATAAAAWGWRRREAWAPLAVMLGGAVVGCSLFAAGFDAGQDGLRGCESVSECGGAFLSPAVDQLTKTAMSTPEAQHPAFELSGAYAASPAVGWSLTTGALYALLILSGVALGRRLPALSRWAAPAAAVTAIVLVSAVEGEDCGGAGAIGRDPATNPLGLLAVSLALACAAIGLGALTRRRWIAGSVALAAGLAIAGVTVIVLAAMDCAFY